MTLRNLALTTTLLLACSTETKISPGGGGGGGGNDSGGTTGTGGKNSGGNAGGSGSGGQAGFFNVPDAGPVTDGGGAGSSDANCGLTTVKLESKPPEIMMVFDRSSSMNMIVPGTMNSRFTEASAAIADVLTKTNATVQWGLKLFPTGAMMCNINPGVEVAVAAMTGPSVSNAIAGAVPGMPTGTPTPMAVMMGTEHLKMRTTSNPKYILLVTDGEPNCANGNGGGGGNSAMASVMAIQAAATAGFHTFVVGIATAGTDADTTLNNMAMAGGEARMGATKYYPATLRDELVTVLTQITGQVTNCIFPLGKQPPSPNDVAVRVGNMRIERNMMNGWEYGMGMQSVVLYGAACELAKSGAAGNVQIIFGCPNVPIP
jgi:hypothetical protein